MYKVNWRESEKIANRVTVCYVLLWVVLVIAGVYVAQSKASAQNRHIAQQNRQTEAATLNRAHAAWHPATGTVIARGPYAGDAAKVSYRLVTVRYPNWQHQMVSSERMMSWSTQKGQSVTLWVNQAGYAYMRGDLNRGSQPNPYSPTIHQIGQVDEFSSGTIPLTVFGGGIVCLIVGMATHALLVDKIIPWHRKRKAKKRTAIAAT